MLRYGKPVAEKIEWDVKQWLNKHEYADKYIAIIMLWADHPWAAYVRSKEKCAERLWISVKVFWNENKKWTEVDMIGVINHLHNDSQCIGIMIQLPMPDHMQGDSQKIMNTIPWYKDVDGLTTFMKWVSESHPDLFVPATPRAVFSMIEYYQYDVKWKKIAMLGNSDLIGKPLTSLLRYHWADVKVFTIESDQQEMKRYCREESNMIISATWHIHLVNEEFVRDDKSQIVVDVGWGYQDGKAVGDVMWEEIENKVAAVTPVPGGIWPVTVVSLFANIVTIQNNLDRLSVLWE